MIKIKVCGLTSPENIREISETGIDFAGFIFYPESKRFVGHKPDVSLFNNVPESVTRVGVFVNEIPARIMDISIISGLPIVQLHGDEDPDYCKAIRSSGLKVIKAFRIASEINMEYLNIFNDVCDYFLFDTASESYGGSGRKFDWRILNGLRIEKPFFLGGGIGPEDTEELEKIENPMFFAVDINSRFEIKPGIKDAEKIKDFIKKLKIE